MILTARNLLTSLCHQCVYHFTKCPYSLEGQVYPKMLIFISVGLIRISIGLSKTHQYKSAPEMFIFGFKSHHTGPKTLIYPRKTIN